jgi:hypothetical protein
LKDALQANIIAENIYSQINSEGRSFAAILKEIIDHRKNGHALSKDDSFFLGKGGQKYPKKTTKAGIYSSKGKTGPLHKCLSRISKTRTLSSLLSMQKPTSLWKRQLLHGGHRRFCADATELSIKLPHDTGRKPISMGSNFRSLAKKLLRLMRKQVPTSGAWQSRKR